MNHSQDLRRTQWVVGRATDQSWERVNCASARITSVKKERILYKRGGTFFTLETFFLFMQGPQIVSIYTVLNNGFNLGPFSWKCLVSPSHCCLSVSHSQVQTPRQPPLLLRLPVHPNAFENSPSASRSNCFLPGEKKNHVFNLSFQRMFSYWLILFLLMLSSKSNFSNALWCTLNDLFPGIWIIANRSLGSIPAESIIGIPTM